jgi:hypothetical protein
VREEAQREEDVKNFRDFVLRVLRSRFKTDPSPDVHKRLETQADPDQLSRWFDLALVVPTLADFEAALRG